MEIRNMENHLKTDPFEVLHAEHREVLLKLQELEDAVTSIVGKGFSAEAFSRIAGVIRFFGTEFKKHDRIEEQVLFPLIEAHIQGSTSMYRVEHRQLWSAFDRLQKSVQDVEMSKVHGSTIREIVDASRAIIELLRIHVAKENGELFPLAKKVLSEEEFSKLTAISHFNQV